MRIFQALGLRGIVFIIITAILFAFYAQYRHLGHEVKDQATTITKQETTIASQADTIKTDGVVKKLNEDTQVAVQRDVKQSDRKHESIAQKVDTQEREITQHFASLPPSVDNMVLEQQQLSESRIDGLWEAYCAAKPDAVECATPPGEPHA